MQIKEVVSRKDRQMFFQLPFSLYRTDKNWIAPLRKEVENIFNPKKNNFYKHGSAKQWILFDNKRQVTGRIAAFYTKRYKNKGDDIPVGGIGFFECENKQSSADLLFDTAKKWLKEQACEAMDGPVNFGERDKFWGLLTEGFHTPLYGMNYHLPYYKELFLNYGFEIFYEQLCFGVDDVQRWENPKIESIYEHLKDNPDYKIRYLEKKYLQRYASDFAKIYNEAWASHGGNKIMHKKIAYAMFKKMRFIIEEQLCYFVYYKNEPMGVMLNIPDINFFFKRFKGKMGWWGKVKFLYLQKIKKPKRVVGMVYGISPKGQGKGLDALMIISLKKYLQTATKYQYYEMQWIGDFNQKMVRIARQIAPVITRKLVTFRYLFDREKPFKRHPFIS